jgi:hypothetical protein
VLSHSVLEETECVCLQFSGLFSTCLSQPSAEEDLEDGEEEEEEEEDEECASEEENQVSVLKNCFLAMVDTLSKQVLEL